MGLTINLEFDTDAAAAPAGFRTAVTTAAAMLDSAVAAPITTNLMVGYGEFRGTVLGSQAGAEGGPSTGLFESYSSVRADLIAEAAPGDTSFNSLPSGSTIKGQSQVAVWNAELKAFGLLAPNANTDDGAIGIGTAVPQASLVGVALHELAHALGRLAYAGPSGQPDIFDLFRFTSTGTRLFNDTLPSAAADFSVDGGNRKLADYGETSDSSDFLNPPAGNLTPEDPFNEFYDNNTIQRLTNVDFAQLDVLGFGATVKNPAPSPAATADLILRRSDGSYEIYDIGNNAILGAFSLTHIAPDFQVAGTGNFSGRDRSDMLLRNSAGTFEVCDVKANNVTSVTTLGNVGNDWQVVGVGDFNGDHTSDMLLRNTAGRFEVYDINANTVSFANSLGNVGTAWKAVGIGDFNGDGTSDMVLRNGAGTLEVYDINANRVTFAASPGNVGTDWTLVGIGDFNGDGTSDMLLRNGAGTFEVYDISANKVVSASSLGNVGTDWKVVGFGDFGGDTSDMLLRNATGAFEVYDISANRVVSAAALGTAPTDWQVAGIASGPSALSLSASVSPSAIDRAQLQLVQAMAGFSQSSGFEVVSPVGLASDAMAQNALLAAHPFLGNHA